MLLSSLLLSCFFFLFSRIVRLKCISMLCKSISISIGVSRADWKLHCGRFHSKKIAQLCLCLAMKSLEQAKIKVSLYHQQHLMPGIALNARTPSQTTTTKSVFKAVSIISRIPNYLCQLVEFIFILVDILWNICVLFHV